MSSVESTSKPSAMSSKASADQEVIEVSTTVAGPEKPSVQAAVAPTRRLSWLGLFNLVLILVLAGAAAYYWYHQQQSQRDYLKTISELRGQIAIKADSSVIGSSLAPLRGEIDKLGGKTSELERQQQDLKVASENLFRLFGRDKNAWQLAEVEYLMRVAQHKLILENDFAGAALTLQAASDKIGLTGDSGMLPVRVQISDEIAELKTRKRPDLVGMTLVLAQLSRQVRSLVPGFPSRIGEAMPESALPESPSFATEIQAWTNRVSGFVDSLVTVRHEATHPTRTEASVVNVGETLADNLKLARWSVLDRDAHQYQLLLDRSIDLFRQFYNLDNAANHDFYSQLQVLQKSAIKPEKPDISGSLRRLQRILASRDTEPAEARPTEIESQ